MIVSCPRCATGFALANAALGNAGRKVRCGNCGHVWLQAVAPEPPLDSPVTMEPGQDVISDAPGCLPPDLLEVDEPIGAGALDVTPVDLVVPDAGAEFAGEGEEVLTLEPSDAVFEEDEEVEEEEAAEADAPDASETAEEEKAEEIAAETADAAAAPTETQEPAAEPAKESAVPEAWRAPGLAALAPLVAAIAEDEARKSSSDTKAQAEPAQDASEPGEKPAAGALTIEAPAGEPEAASADVVLEGAEIEPAAAIAADMSGLVSGPDVAPEPEAPESAESAPVPVEIAAPELALLAATTFAPPSVVSVVPDTIALPPIEIPEPGPPTIIVAMRDERAKESDGVDDIAPPPAPVIDEDLRPEEAVAPEAVAARLKRHRRLRYGATIGALALIAGGLVANEATQPDGPAALLASIRTGGAPPADAGLGFANVTTHRTAVGGVPMLMVTGEVVNDSPRPRAVPTLRGSLLYGEREIQFWTFSAAPPKLDPGQRASFETVLRNPAIGATDVRVTFSVPGS